MQYKLHKIRKAYFTHCMENIFDTILLIGTPITDKNTQVFYTRSKRVTGFSVI